jgi:hypothetical protein
MAHNQKQFASNNGLQEDGPSQQLETLKSGDSLVLKLNHSYLIFLRAKEHIM